MDNTEGKSKVLIGLQYGDEGKARVLDKIIEGSDVVARFNGGANAGHTLVVGDKEIALHLIPSGIFHPDMQLYIGSGCVLYPETANKEIENIANLGIDLDGKLRIAANTTLVQPHHLLLDGIFGKGIGTTGNGIGPAYADRALRTDGKTLKNLRVCDYFVNPQKALEIVKANLVQVAENRGLSVDVGGVVSKYVQETEKLRPYYCQDPLFLEKLLQSGNNVFFEGAQSLMLDVATGTVPFVTSSRTLAAAAYTGGDLSMRYHERTIGVAKAIMSRVGNGPFVSEFGEKKSELYCAAEGGNKYKREVESKLYDPWELLKSEDEFEVGVGLRMIGKEYGATTKRPRRIGMLDLVMLRQNCMLNSVDELYINKFDCLVDFSKSSLGGIPVVVAYRLDGKTIDYMPTTAEECERTEPVVEYLPHITQDISQMRSYDDLPPEAKGAVSFIEEKVGTPVYGIGVGPERDQFIKIR